MQLFGYSLVITKVKRHNRPTASNYKVWSRKGRCPLCNVAQGSKHNKECKAPEILRKGKTLAKRYRIIEELKENGIL